MPMPVGGRDLVLSCLPLEQGLWGRHACIGWHWEALRGTLQLHNAPPRAQALAHRSSLKGGGVPLTLHCSPSLL